MTQPLASRIALVTGAYPTHLTDHSEAESVPRQLSLLAEAS